MPATNVKKLQDETRKVIVALDALAVAPVGRMSFTDAYRGGFATSGGVNFSLAACDAASAITGYDPFACRKLNHRFRHVAAKLVMDRALAA